MRVSVLAGVCLLALSACANPYDPGQRALTGAGIGAGSGAAIGSLAGKGRGAAIGGLAGGALGSVVHGSALELWKALEQSELFSITVSQA